MASRSLNDLFSEMERKIRLFEKDYEDNVGSLLIYCTERSLHEQAELYRQSRSWYAIKTKMRKFKLRGYGVLADIIEEVGPQYGPHVTNAAPGESWHAYGEAIDCVPMRGGKCLWDVASNRYYWNQVGFYAEKQDLHWAGRWTRFREYPHIQYRVGSNPLKMFDPDTVLEILSSRNLI